jgi:proteasome alpha subunit
LYDGNISDEKGYTVIGGRSEAIKIFLKERYRSKMTLKDAVTLSTEALESAVNMKLPKENMEVAVLDRNRDGRKFKRIKIDELSELLNN